MSAAVLHALWLVVLVGQAEEAGRLELRLDSQAMTVGEIVSADLVCTNTAAPGLPQVVLPEGLDLKLLSATPSTMSQMTWINGRSTRRVTHTFPLRIVASAPGDYVLGPISVQAGGQTYQTNPVRLVVTPRSTEPRGDRVMFAELQVTPRRLYVTQSYQATLMVGMRRVEIGGRVHPMNLIKLIDTSRSELSVFANGRATSSELRLPDSQGAVHEYEVFRVAQEVRAQQVGPLTVGPVFLRADYPTRLRFNIWGEREIVEARSVTASADAITIEVLGPPLEGRPDAFRGAIGSFNMTVAARPDHVEQGQPVTLSIAFTGGPLDGVGPPDLASNAELVSRFEFAQDELVGDLEGDARVFRRAIFPRQVGEQVIPPIAWAYFDPRREQYVSLRSDPIPITVEPASVLGPSIPRGSDLASGNAETGLTPLSGGISPNVVDAGRALVSQAPGFSTARLVELALAPPVVWLLTTFFVHRRRWMRADAGRMRRRRAYRVACRRLQAARNRRDPAQSVAQLREALAGYLTDRLNLPPGSVTPEDVRGLTAVRQLPAEVAGELAGFLEQLDLARYAPGTLTGPGVEESADRVAGWIERMERICK